MRAPDAVAAQSHGRARLLHQSQRCSWSLESPNGFRWATRPWAATDAIAVRILAGMKLLHLSRRCSWPSEGPNGFGWTSRP
mmetsp:Transcript_38735/g.123170  ORF Transcript_38735/g.123170 Transcript_38735/m.123170 type:complete len:81 (-) Transcript_38735:1111-1353(-)